MQAVDNVFQPLDPNDPVHRTEPISVKKLLKGDASWATCKKVLGWIIDLVNMTLTLPERRLKRLGKILAEIGPERKRLALDKWHKLIGELRSMSIAIPGARGLFSHLQAAHKTQANNRLRLTAGFHQALDDFSWLQDSLAQRPTRLQELVVPTNPSLVGTHDASGFGNRGGRSLDAPSHHSRTRGQADCARARRPSPSHQATRCRSRGLAATIPPSHPGSSGLIFQPARHHQ
jgi:hypothetical protein